LGAPIVCIAATPDGGGYWLVGSDGGVFGFGDARYHGSVPASHSIHLGAPIVGVAVTRDGGGYWLVGSDGGVFGFGDAAYRGSVPGTHSIHLADPIVGVTADTTGGAGYWLAGGQPACLPANCIAQGPVLALGSTGSAVLALQNRLIALGYWLAPADGTFGYSTQQAVYALQKAAGIGRDGIVGPTTRAALSEGVVPHPRSTAGYVIEVDLEDDLVMFVNNGKLEYTLNTSTGGGYEYSNGSGGTDIATTPTGLFHTYREVDGLVTDYLGQLWMPKFFTGGFAIHGDSDVPPEPVSHGCVRVSDEAIEWIWAANLDPIGTTVWVY
jgi:hypothetical protein